MKQKNQRGFVLIATLVMIIGLCSLVIGDFFSLVRQSRTVQKVTDQIRLNWVNESVIDRTLMFFSDFVQTNGKYPEARVASEGGDCVDLTAANSPSGTSYTACEVYNNILGETSGAKFCTLLNNWWTTIQPASVPMFPNVSLNSDTVSIRQVDGTASDMDPSRNYRITFKTTTKSGTKMQTATRPRHDFLVEAGKLFDYFSFANGDLEICPGPSFDLEGPVFSNQNIYLMTAPNNTLTLRAPDDMDPLNKHYYAVHAAGQIYFYFKRAVARNYFLDAAPDGNDVYKASVSRFYRTDEPSQSGQYAGFFGGGYADGLTWTQCDGRGGCWARWPSSNKEGLTGVFSSVNHGVERIAFGFPLLYYFANDIALPVARMTTSNIYPKIKFKKGNRDASPGEVVDMPYPESNQAKKFVFYAYGGLSYDAKAQYKFLHPLLYDYLDRRLTQWGGILNVSPMIPVDMSIDYSLFYPAMDMAKGWTPESPNTTQPLPNPLWASNTITENYVADSTKNPDITPVAIPIGGTSFDTHLLIDPAKDLCANVNDCSNPSCDCHRVRVQKLWTQAHIQLRCNPTDNCGTYKTWEFSAKTPANPDGYIDQGESKSSWATYGNLWDYRLGGQFRTLVIDVGLLKTYLETNLYKKDVTGKGFRGYLVYLETANAPYVRAPGPDTRIALVKLVNGDKLPIDGLTIVTNGRVWVEGNYNRYYYTALDADGKPDPVSYQNAACEATDWANKLCHFPPAAIFSDSFGILSGSTDYSDRDLVDRVVNNDVMVNVAVVGGYLPSQLEKVYPNCKGNTSDPAFCFENLEVPNYPTIYSQFFGPLDDGCPSGFDGSGFPNDPETCWMTHDTTGGKSIYNTRTIKYASPMIQAMREESYGYSEPNAFAGCENRKTTWQTTYALSYDNTSDYDSTDGLADASAAKKIWCPRAPDVTQEPWKKLYEGTAQRWSDLTPAEMEALKNLGNMTNVAGVRTMHYKIPVEVWDTETSDWDLYCCDNPIKPPMGFNGCAAPYKCGPSIAGWNPDKVWYREFSISFNWLPEVSNYNTPDSVQPLPYFASDWFRCQYAFFNDYLDDYQYLPSGDPDPSSKAFSEYPYSRRASSLPSMRLPKFSAKGRILDYKHGCQVDAAPLMAGVDIIPIVTDQLSSGKTSAIWTPASGCTAGVCTTQEAGEVTCTPSVCTTPAYSSPPVRTHSFFPYYSNNSTRMPLYNARYSGGLENFINFQELWERMGASPYIKTIRFCGVMTKAWDSKQLKTASDIHGNNLKMAYWGTSYYRAPGRSTRYNQDLRRNPPAGTPGIYSLRRSRFHELNPDDESNILGAL